MMLYLFVFFFGLTLGSFFNVVIYRLPEGKSIITPASHCPYCQTPLKWYHNIPVISYVFLKGKCAFCGQKISPRYPLVEFLTAVLILLTYYKFSPFISWKAFVWALSFVLFLIPITFIDFEKKIIPDSLSLGLLFLGWLFALIKLNPLFDFKHSVFKLMGAIGAYLGYESFYSVILSASVIGIAVVFCYFLYGKLFKKDIKTPEELMKWEIPFGPFLCLGALLYLYGFFRLVPFN